MPRRRYTDNDPEPHGTTALITYYVTVLPDTPRRRYGRRMIRGLASRCARCRTADKARARARRLHTAYRRRAR